MANAMPRPPARVSTWREALLIPKGTDMNIIHRLSDVPKYGGKILKQQYWE
jgi:hypothetical protein